MHSQLRITIERAIGVFIGTWGIFWRDLLYDVDSIMEIVHACVRLHNFLIVNRRSVENPTPIIHDTYAQPEHAQTNEAGVLMDPVWTDPMHTSPAGFFSMTQQESAAREAQGANSVKAAILEKIQELELVIVRDHHK